MKRRTLMTLLLLSTLLLSISCSLLSRPNTDEQKLTEACQNAVKNLQQVQQVKLPEHFNQENPIRDGSEFDPNVYFTVLTHLSMQPGTTLDYVYYQQFLGGYPVLYARPTDTPRYPTLPDLPAALQEGDWHLSIQTDDTPEGFIELAVLYIHGGQFYLSWHANYNDLTVLATRDHIDNMIKEANGDFGAEMDLLTQTRARALDPQPVVEMDEDRVTVKLLTFTKWGGFYTQTMIFSRAFPHTLLDSSIEERVPYDCGVMF